MRLPPGCGADLDEPLLFNPYQNDFMEARRKRFCLNCRTIGSMNENSVFICAKCERKHDKVQHLYDDEFNVNAEHV